MNKRRVVVTGLGMITPLGNDVRSTWQGILESKSGIAKIDTFDVSDFSVQIAGLIKDFDPTNYLSAKEAKKMDMFMIYGMAAAIEAMRDSGLTITDDMSRRAGVAIGSGIGGLESIEKTTLICEKRGPRKISPFFIPSTIINLIAGHLSVMYNLKGPNIAIVTACTSGTHNIGYAAKAIANGEADIMLAGGAEKASTPLGIGGFAAMKALSATNNDTPEKASKPFDKNRDGFVLGDGAGVVVLEEYNSAKQRGAKIYAELVGFGVSGDAYHMTMPAENGQGAADCMQAALDDAGVTAESVDYINAHGTSTPANDRIETLGIKRVFGEHAKKLAVSSTKSMTGHTLGAAGAIEAIFSILAIRDQVAPPTINLENPDEACDLDYVPDHARAMPITYAMSNSFGFGGTNGTLLFKQV